MNNMNENSTIQIKLQSYNLFFIKKTITQNIFKQLKYNNQ